MKPFAFSPLLLSLALASCSASPERGPAAPTPAAPLPPAPPAPAESPSPAATESPAKNEPPAFEPLRVEKAGPDALSIEGDGVRVVLRAKPMQGRKGWGLKVTAEATSVDGLEHRFALISGKVPFLFSGSLHHGGPDEKTNFFEGEIQGAPPKEREVGPSSAVTFGRDYPEGPGGLWVTRGKALTLWAIFGTVSSSGSGRPGREWGTVGTIEMWVPKSGAPSLLLKPVEPNPNGRPGGAG